MPAAESPSPSRADRAGLIVGPAAVVVMAWWLATRTGPDVPSGPARLLLAIGSAVPWTAMWLAAAAGFGWPLRRLLAPDAPRLQWPLGMAALLVLDQTLGRLGLLQPAGAWALVIGGTTLLLAQGWRGRGRPGPAPPALTLWLAMPALAVLLVAAGSAPGWLWASEFGGYDVLSYHLQLPREWMALGRLHGLEHNVYSFLPGYVESAYYHLAALRGDPVAVATAAQLLHASFAVMTAVMVGFVAAPHERAAFGAAAVLVLATPWTIVAGSLAYDEMVVTLMLAAGLLAADRAATSPLRSAAAVGVLAAAACGAKLTAAGFVAAPLGLVLLVRLPPGRRLAGAAAASGGALLVLGPYLIGNLAQTGNPLFPFLASTLGRAHWSLEQVAIWNGAHGSSGTIGARLVEAWHQWPAYGLGPNPDPREPWAPQWSILPWLAIGAWVVALRRRETRRPAAALGVVLLVQLVFWLAFTHVKSRFMLPSVVPCAAVVALALRPAIERWWRRRIAAAAVRAALFAMACVPVLIFLGEGGGRPSLMLGLASARSGEGLDDRARRDWAEAWPEILVNHLLPPGSRVLLVGEAAPYYYGPSRIGYQTTWDRGPMSAVLAAHPGDPQACFAALRRDGWTHLLINPDMLDVWDRSGWNDPLLRGDALLRASDAHLRAVHRYPSGVVLYALTRADGRMSRLIGVETRLWPAHPS